MLSAWGFGYFLNWRTTAYFLIIPPIILILLILFIPETPYWLVENSRFKEAKNSLEFMRGKEYDVTEEFNEIIQRYQIKMEESKSSEMTSWKILRSLVTEAEICF